jgi:SAM-dependent methyltransferase
MDWVIPFSVCVVQIGFGIFFISMTSIFLAHYWGAPWVTTPLHVVRAMLQLADIKSNELVVDLGAGDGRIVLLAAKEFQARAVGVEIDPLRFLMAKLLFLLLGVHNNAAIRYGNLFALDLSDADVVTVFLTRKTNRDLKPFLESCLKPGTRVISYSFPFPDWTPIIIDDSHMIFVYIIGRTGPETTTKFV